MLSQSVSRSRWVERTGQVIAQIHDVVNGAPFNIRQDGLKRPAISMNVGEDRHGERMCVIRHRMHLSTVDPDREPPLRERRTG